MSLLTKLNSYKTTIAGLSLLALTTAMPFGCSKKQEPKGIYHPIQFQETYDRDSDPHHFVPQPESNTPMPEYDPSLTRFTPGRFSSRDVSEFLKRKIPLTEINKYPANLYANDIFELQNKGITPEALSKYHACFSEGYSAYRLAMEGIPAEYANNFFTDSNLGASDVNSIIELHQNHVPSDNIPKYDKRFSNQDKVSFALKHVPVEYANTLHDNFSIKDILDLYQNCIEAKEAKKLEELKGEIMKLYSSRNYNNFDYNDNSITPLDLAKNEIRSGDIEAYATLSKDYDLSINLRTIWELLDKKIYAKDLSEYARADRESWNRKEIDSLVKFAGEKLDPKSLEAILALNKRLDTRFSLDDAADFVKRKIPLKYIEEEATRKYIQGKLK